METIAVIGLGSIGMRHARNLRSLGHHVWGVDPDIGPRLEFGFDCCCTDPATVRSKADAFVIASPTTNHYGHAILLAGRPIFIEKPISSSQVYSTCGVVMVGYNQRFHPAVLMAKRKVMEIGFPLSANFICAQHNDKPAYLRDGVILNWSHEIDLALHLLGPAKVVASHTRLTDGKDDLTDIILQHDNGCRTTIHLDYLAKPERRYFTICGDKATIHVDLPDRTFRLTEADGCFDEIGFEGSYDDDYITEMKAFIARINGEAVPGCTAQEAVDVLNICLKVREGAGLCEG